MGRVILFYMLGALSAIAMVPLLFVANSKDLRPSIQSDTFKVVVCSSLVVALILMVDLIIDFFSRRTNLKQLFVRVVICVTLALTSCLHIYFSLKMNNASATLNIIAMRSVMCAVISVHQVHLRNRCMLINASIALCWCAGIVLRSYGQHVPILKTIGSVTYVLALLVTAWGLFRRCWMVVRGRLVQDWYDKWQQTAFEMLIIITMISVVANTIYWKINGTSEMDEGEAMIQASIVSVMFLILLSTIITNEHRYEFDQIQKKLGIKQYFVRHVSHEIRTPLNCCKLGVKFLKTAILRPAEHSTEELLGILDEVTEGCNSALGFVNNLLMYEKIDTAELPLFLKREDISVLCEEVYKSFTTSARELDIVLSLDIHDSLLHSSAFCDSLNSSIIMPYVDVDGPKICIVLRNFLSNALKFTPRGGRVSLSVTPIHLVSCAGQSVLLSPSPDAETTHIRVIISDTGQGMTLQEQEQLFTKIVQFSPNENQKGGGSGIGLFLSHHIMREHKLKIQVNSTSEGTNFYIDFPIFCERQSSSAPGTPTTRSSRTLGSSGLRTHIFPFLPKSRRVVCAEEEGANVETDEEMGGLAAVVDTTRLRICTTFEQQSVFQNTHGIDGCDSENDLSVHDLGNVIQDMKILVVDDSDLNRKMLIRTLKQNHIGSTYTSLSDGSELLNEFGVEVNASIETLEPDKLSNKKSVKDNKEYDVILLDDNMAKINGSVAIRKLRECGYDGLVIGLTGSASEDDLSSFREAGANYALSKPFEVDAIVDIIRTHNQLW